MSPTLPPPRHDPYAVAVVCLGNICRSPIAAVVLAKHVADAGLASRVRVESAGTGAWHVGHGINPSASAVLSTAGYDSSAHRAKQIEAGWFEEYDVLLAMDRHNYRDIISLSASAADRDRVLLFRAFDPSVDAGAVAPDVPDPWGGPPSEFEGVLEIVERSARAVVDELHRVLG